MSTHPPLLCQPIVNRPDKKLLQNDLKKLRRLFARMVWRRFRAYDILPDAA